MERNREGKWLVSRRDESEPTGTAQAGQGVWEGKAEWSHPALLLFLSCKVPQPLSRLKTQDGGDR